MDPKSIDEEERKKMKEFWSEHALKQGADMNTMLLDHNARDIIEKDTPEVLSMVPNYNNKDVLELAAGIGRFTSILAQDAKSVVAIEFMESFSKKNEEENGHMNNIEFICDDVLNYVKENDSFDLVFTCWLLMYLADNEVRQLLDNILHWLRPNGYIFIRESCFGPSGSINRTTNPTHYRTPKEYLDLFRNSNINRDDKNYTYKLIHAKNLESYVYHKGLKGQMCWVFQKVEINNQSNQRQDFFDNFQYSPSSIIRYEKIYGDGFVSAGGIETTKQFTELLDIQPNDRILDIGCGLGGGDFYMASNYQAHVHGIDISTNMIHLALERAIVAPREYYITFEIADIMNVQFPEQFSKFDIIYSRDTFLHIEDKEELFRKLFNWLNPGGKLLFSDYCLGSISDEMQEYINTYNYSLATIEEYQNILTNTGFDNIIVEDKTNDFINTLRIEKENISEKVALFSEEDYEHLIQGWDNKIRRASNNEQKWGFFQAQKPL